MRAKFCRRPTVVSKKARLTLIIDLNYTMCPIKGINAYVDINLYITSADPMGAAMIKQHRNSHD